jgi:hypothetical protein
MAGCPVNGCQWHGGTDSEFLAHLKLVAKEFKGDEPHKELLAKREPKAVVKEGPSIAPPAGPQVHAPSTK